MSDINQEKQHPTFYKEYCICGTFALVMDQPITKCPKRELDETYILIKPTVQFRHNMEYDEKLAIERKPNQYELQQRLRCTGCNLPLGYYLEDIETLEKINSMKPANSKKFEEQRLQRDGLHVFIDGLKKN